MLFSEKYIPWKLRDDKIIPMLTLSYISVPISQTIHFLAFPDSKLYGHWITKGTHLEGLSVMVTILSTLGFIFVSIQAALFHVHIYLIPLSLCFQTLKECKYDQKVIAYHNVCPHKFH